jgi:putative oxidoreductase
VSPTRRLARPMLASMFIVGGFDALRQPGPRIEAARKAGLTDPERLVRVKALADLAAGLALATDRVPRLASLALAGSIVPTTYVGHPFWQEKDKAARKQQQIHFFKNVGLLGGLLLATADTGGRESIPHAAGRVTREAKKEAGKAARKARKDAARAADHAAKRAAKIQKRTERRARKALGSSSPGGLSSAASTLARSLPHAA